MKDVSAFPPFVHQLMGKLPNHLALAGGAMRFLADDEMRWEDVRDWDFFRLESSGGSLGLLGNYITTVLGGREIRPDNWQGETYTYQLPGGKIQIINITLYEDAKDVISEFDLVPCCAAYNGVEGLVCHPDWEKCVVERRIRLAEGASSKAGTLIQRISKYIKKGFTVDEGVWREVVHLLQASNPYTRVHALEAEPDYRRDENVRTGEQVAEGRNVQGITVTGGATNWVFLSPEGGTLLR